jgi:hypothetical protein
LGVTVGFVSAECIPDAAVRITSAALHAAFGLRLILMRKSISLFQITTLPAAKQNAPHQGKIFFTRVEFKLFS